MSRTKIRTHIKGLDWDIYLLKSNEYEKYIDIEGDNTLAVCLVNEHKIVFRYEHLSLPTVKHELTHAYAASCFCFQLNLSGEQVAELKCEIMAYHGEELIKLSKKIFKMLKKIEKELK